MEIRKDLFGIDGQKKRIYTYTLKNNRGMEVKISQLGGTLISLVLPLAEGPVDIVLGFDQCQAYFKNPHYFGAIIGRFANRIRGGSFTLDNRRIQLDVNEGAHHLHGGTRGLDKVLWKSQSFRNDTEVGVRLTHKSPSGDQGYPGSLAVTVDYALTNENHIKTTYLAVSDQKTPVNLTNHSYFNLNGAGQGTVLDHELTIYANRYTPVDSDLIPTGEIRDVSQTFLDFQTPRLIGDQIGESSGGYDHNYVFDKYFGKMAPAAKVYSPRTKIGLEISTTKPGLQFYTGNHLDGTLTGKGGKSVPSHGGLCLEDQHFPDSPNQTNFPTTIIKPGTFYSHQTVYKCTF